MCVNRERGIVPQSRYTGDRSGLRNAFIAGGTDRAFEGVEAARQGRSRPSDTDNPLGSLAFDTELENRGGYITAKNVDASASPLPTEQVDAPRGARATGSKATIRRRRELAIGDGGSSGAGRSGSSVGGV